MKTRALASAVVVGLVLALFFIPLFVYASHLAHELLGTSFDRLFSSQIAACEKGECLGLGFRVTLWSLEGAITLGPILFSVTPLAVGAALVRKNSWVSGIALGCGAAAFMLLKSFWLLFAPSRMPGWLFVPVFGATVVLTFGIITTVFARFVMAPNPSLERTREG